MVIQFRIALIPTAKGRPRAANIGGHVRMFTPKETQRAEETFSSLAAPHAPPAPLVGPLAVTLGFTMPMPASWPQWRQEAGGHHESRPDLDNLCKLVLDALQRSGAWWRDDAQVARMTASKGYGGPPGTLVTIEQLEQPTRPVRGRATTQPSVAQAALFTR